jgi:hypothetical protein
MKNPEKQSHLVYDLPTGSCTHNPMQGEPVQTTLAVCDTGDRLSVQVKGTTMENYVTDQDKVSRQKIQSNAFKYSKILSCFKKQTLCFCFSSTEVVKNM